MMRTQEGQAYAALTSAALTFTGESLGRGRLAAGLNMKKPRRTGVHSGLLRFLMGGNL